MKRTLLCMICVLALVLSLASSAMAVSMPATNPLLPSVASSGDDTGLDIVIVIDRSGTMNKTDPRDIALAATNMMIDRCDTRSTSIAVLGYGYDITLDTGFVNLDDANAVAAMESKVSNLGIKRGDDTNTGLALRRAKDMIDQRAIDHPLHTFAILVISDGKIDIGDSSEAKSAIKTTGKTRDQLTEESRRMAFDVADECAAQGIPICCLGVYTKNNNTLGTDMEDWTRTTGGKYIATDNIGDAYEAVRELHLFINGQSDDQGTVDSQGYFDIPAGVSQANIEVLPGTPESNIAINWEDDTGTWRPYQLDPGAVTYTKQYTIVRLYYPTEGHYQITLLDGTQAQFKLSVNYSRDLAMYLSAPRQMNNEDTTNDIRLDVRKQGSPYYDGRQPTLRITDQNGQVQTVQMNWDANENIYTASFTPHQVGVYTLRAILELNGFDNVSNDFQITVSKASITKERDFDPSDLTFSGHPLTVYDSTGEGHPGYQPHVITDLGSYFRDTDGRGIVGFTYQFKNAADSKYAQIDLDTVNGTLTITPLMQTPNAVEFELYATGGDGSTSQAITGQITIQDAKAPVTVNRANDFIANQLSEGIVLKGLLPQKEGTVVIENLYECFTEPNAADGEGFTFTLSVPAADVAYGVDNPDDIIEWQEVNEGQRALVLTGLREGEVELTVTATSYDSSSDSFTVKVRVVNLLKTLLLIGGGVLLAIILIIVLIVIVTERNKPVFKKNAVLGVRLLNDGDEEEGSCILLKFGKGPAKMTDICAKCGISTSGMRKVLEGIRLYPRKSSSIEIRYKVNGKNATATLSHNDAKDIQLDQDGDRLLTLTYIEEGMDDYD